MSEAEPVRRRDETLDERADRNWVELLQELRVSQTGVQLIAGFLVTLPFLDGFADLDDFQRGWYLGLLGLAFLIVGLMLSPVAIHRHLFRGHAKTTVVTVAHILTEIAVVLIAALLAGISFLVVDMVLDRLQAAVAGVVVASVLIGLLVVLPRLVSARQR